MEDREDSSLTKSFLFLFIIGFFIIFIGITFLVAAALFSGGQVNFGALIFIGPFPIVIGAGPEAVWMILFAVVLSVLSIVIFLVFYKRRM
ncbi:hypothetical protein DRO59_06365 [Candidatus Bathyarchaeota archaeon]|nr:MAG: hypothetical protein DRO59_06365 [Candidatus Bathyarchaeota archaeon]